MNERVFGTYISNLRSQELKERRPRNRYIYCCHHGDAEAEMERRKQQPLVTDEEELETRICEKCKGYYSTQSEMMEVTFGKDCRNEDWSTDNVRVLELPN